MEGRFLVVQFIFFYYLLFSLCFLLFMGGWMQVLTGHGQNKYYSKEVIFYKSLSEKKKGDKVMIRKK